MSIDVYAFDGSGMKEPPNKLGGLSFHLHDIISVRAVSGSYEVWDEYAVTGLIELEITFNYGMFGFGYSNQVGRKQ